MCTSDWNLMEILCSLITHGRACTCERCLAGDGTSVCPKRMGTEIDRRFLGTLMTWDIHMMFPLLLKKDSGIDRAAFVRYLEKPNAETWPMLLAKYINHSGFYMDLYEGGWIR